MITKRDHDTERRLLAKLGQALQRADHGRPLPGEVEYARRQLREFYRGLGMHP